MSFTLTTNSPLPTTNRYYSMKFTGRCYNLVGKNNKITPF